jgi:hypothetical protein
MTFRSWLWPRVDTRKNALWAIREAFWVTVAVAGFFMVWAVIDIAGSTNDAVDFGGFVFAAIFGLAALAIWCKSRVAAIATFSLHVVTRLFVFFHSGPGGLILVVVVSLAFLTVFAGLLHTINYLQFLSVLLRSQTVSPR